MVPGQHAVAKRKWHEQKRERETMNRARSVVLGAVVLLLLTFQPGMADAGTYRNPLGVVAADPFVYREGDTYYLYATAAADGLLVWTSKDLVHWRERGHAFQRDATTWSQDRFWAPELFKH